MKASTWMVALGLLGALSASAGEGQSFYRMPTGNGLGFQLFDAKASRMLAFLDHPYRFIRPGADIRKDGIERRNLLEDLSLGVDTGTGASWLDRWMPGENGYVQETNVIHAVSTQGASKAERFFFSPFGLEENALVAAFRLDGAAPGARGEARLKFHLGANPVSSNFWDSTLDIVKIPGETIAPLAGPRQAWVLRGKGLGAVVYLPLQDGTVAACEPAGSDCHADELSFTLAAPLGAHGWFGVLVAYVEDTSQLDQHVANLARWVRGRSPEALVQGSLREWDAWRTPVLSSLTPAERALWRQSEAVLRMGQILEPNLHGATERASHGMILASLAPGGWATGWVRDGTYATVALARSGHFAEARDSLDFFLNAEPVGRFKEYVNGYDYRISVTRYFGSGEEEADYSDQKTPNVETDGWGLVLWAARQYVESSHDLGWLSQATRKGSVYEALRDGVAGAIESQLEASPRIMRPDSSIWEVHQENARHFAFTTIAAARGVCDFAALAHWSGHEADAQKYRAIATQMQKDFLPAFTVPEGFLPGAIERSSATDLDSSVMEAYNFGLFPKRGPEADATLAHLEQLRIPDAGFRRVGGPESYKSNEWPFVDFRMASVYLRYDRRDVAADLIGRVVARSAQNWNIIPEMYNETAAEGPLDAYTGSIPMVGYGGGAYLISILDREGYRENAACE